MSPESIFQKQVDVFKPQEQRELDGNRVEFRVATQ